MFLQQFDGVSAVSAAWHHQSSRAPWHNQRPLGSATPLGVSLGAAATAGQEGVFQPRTAKDCKQKFFAQTVRRNEWPADRIILRPFPLSLFSSDWHIRYMVLKMKKRNTPKKMVVLTG